jgi:hypothetical protein
VLSADFTPSAALLASNPRRINAKLIDEKKSQSILKMSKLSSMAVELDS